VSLFYHFKPAAWTTLPHGSDSWNSQRKDSAVGRIRHCHGSPSYERRDVPEDRKRCIASCGKAERQKSMLLSIVLGLQDFDLYLSSVVC